MEGKSFLEQAILVDKLSYEEIGRHAQEVILRKLL